MIIDKIKNINLYTGISEKIAKGLAVLENVDLSKQEEVKHEVNGDDIFYMIQRYTTGPRLENKIESHEQYIDIQYIAAGEELLEYAFIENLKIVEPYDEKKDIAFYQMPERVSKIVLQTGMFCILFPPHDGHMLRVQVNEPTEVLKVLVKVRI